MTNLNTNPFVNFNNTVVMKFNPESLMMHIKDTYEFSEGLFVKSLRELVDLVPSKPNFIVSYYNGYETKTLTTDKIMEALEKFYYFDWEFYECTGFEDGSYVILEINGEVYMKDFWLPPRVVDNTLPITDPFKMN